MVQVTVVPTDTVYGLGADAFNLDATARIFTIKHRPRSLPLPILVSRPRQAWALSGNVPPEAAELVEPMLAEGRFGGPAFSGAVGAVPAQGSTR